MNITYRILQLAGPNKREKSFTSLRMMKTLGLEFDINDYAEVYKANEDIPVDGCSTEDDRLAVCEYLFAKFNRTRPAGYNGHSMSVSDLVELDIDGSKHLYFCDSMGFAKM